MKSCHQVPEHIGPGSHPARGAWIEMSMEIFLKLDRSVAPRTGCVD